VRVGCIDMQVRCIFIFALGHCVLHIPTVIPSLVYVVFHVSLEDAEQ
jgi:hypothetical protein